MVVIALGLLAFAGFIALAEAARRGSESARIAALYEAVLLLPLAGFAAVGSLAIAAVTCDEGCDEDRRPEVQTGNWWDTQDAWQWKALVLVAVIGFLAIAVALVWTARRRHCHAALAMTGAAASFGAWAIVMAPLGDGLGI